MQTGNQGWLSRVLPWLPLLSVWLALFSLAASIWMVVQRRRLGDFEFVMWLDLEVACLAMALAGLVLWGYRKRDASEAGIIQQRLQAKVAIGLSLVAVTVVYLLIILATPVDVGASE